MCVLLSFRFLFSGVGLVAAVLCMLAYPLVPHYALVGVVIGRSLDVSVMCLIFSF